MDAPLTKRRSKRPVQAIIALLFLGLVGVVLSYWSSRGLEVALGSIRVATVESGVFVDEATVRADAAPLSSVILDPTDSGRVEDVFVRDGRLVKQGDPLFRLSNPQRTLELLARQSEVGQQVSNLLNLKVALEAARTQYTHRVADLEFQLVQAKNSHDQNSEIAAQGMVSKAALRDSAQRLAYQQRLLDDERSTGGSELLIKRDAVAQMERVIGNLQSGLKLVKETVDALMVRAPIAGRLTDFQLQVGETVRPDKHIGRIDDPLRFKLTALIDEFYLSRVEVGRPGLAQINAKSYPIQVSKVYKQIKKGRFEVELLFTGAPPDNLNPGQSINAAINLGDPVKALILPTGAFVNDSGGAWVFVASPNGQTAERRATQFGRRSNSQIEVLTGLTAGEKVIVSGYTEYGELTKLRLTP